MTPREIAEARRLRASLSDAAIAVKTGVSRQHLHKVLGPRPARPKASRARAAAAPPTAGPTLAQFAAKLRAWRAKHQLTQSQAATLLHVHKQVISNWETGRNGCALAASMLLLMERYP